MKSYESREWYDGQQKILAASERARNVAFVWHLFVVTLILSVCWILLARF